MTLGSIAAASAVALMGIWLGYPLCVWLAAGLRRAPQRYPDQGAGTLEANPPTVTVILATREDADAVRERVSNILGSAYPSALLDIVIGLDIGARCKGADLAALGPRVRAVTADSPGGKACALNRAVRAASGQVLVFTDTFQSFSPESIAVLVNGLMQDPSAGVVTGSLARGRPESDWHPIDWYWKLERWLRYQESELHSSIGVTGAIYALRRDSWQALPANLILDDLFVPMRLILRGYRARFLPMAQAQDSRPVATQDEFRRKVRTLTGNFQLCAWLPGVLSPWRNVVWLQFVCHKLLRLLTPYLLLALIGSLFLLAEQRVGLQFAVALLLASLGAMVLLASPINRSATLRALVLSFVLMPVAATVAAWNAVGGNWSVWGPPSANPAAIGSQTQ
jgi:cellulose synthase/poly-beta-1,6-N-acetylglucosamine synthase-like glycosyltransferase